MADRKGPCAIWGDGERTYLAHDVEASVEAHDYPSAIGLVDELRKGLHGPGPWFGGMAFPAANSWPGFPAARFIRAKHVKIQPVAALSDAKKGAFSPAGVLNESLSSDFSDLIALATEEFEKGQLTKVVVAREIDVPVRVEGEELFHALRANVPAARHFLFQSPEGACFVGATPETLLHLKGNRVEVDALAGSCAPSGVFREKERREHDVVVQEVAMAFGDLRAEVPASPSVMQLPYVWHLHSRIGADVDASFDFAQFLTRLFPTSAVAGMPRDTAFAFIRQNESLVRGWYAGAVGRIDEGEVDLAVALRCALVEENRVRLFAGAGIVQGSNAQEEWEEISRKTIPARHALAIALGEVRA